MPFISTFGGGSAGARGFGRAQFVLEGLFDFTSATFTTGGSTGRFGPSLSQARSGLSVDRDDSWKNDTAFFNVSGGIQEWTVPATGSYEIDAYGSESLNDGGWSSQTFFRGARARDTVELEEGEIIKILCGQPPEGVSQSANPGSGGTYVIKSPYNTQESILVIAGGAGGGESNPDDNFDRAGQSSTSGANGKNGVGPGGTNGNGGGTDGGGNAGGGGGGFFTDGADNSYWSNPGGDAFVNGGIGAPAGTANEGGFGGGGGGAGAGPGGGPGGGGGYSGGGGGDNVGGSYAGGGGSITNGNGNNSLVEANVNADSGYCIITRLR